MKSDTHKLLEKKEKYANMRKRFNKRESDININNNISNNSNKNNSNNNNNTNNNKNNTMNTIAIIKAINMH